MKKLLTAVVCLTAMACSCRAQNNIKVIGFRLLENDLTANTRGTSKTDQNGETAALVKI